MAWIVSWSYGMLGSKTIQKNDSTKVICLVGGALCLRGSASRAPG
jgi:hypothetical protein